MGASGQERYQPDRGGGREQPNQVGRLGRDSLREAELRRQKAQGLSERSARGIEESSAVGASGAMKVAALRLAHHPADSEESHRGPHPLHCRKGFPEEDVSEQRREDRRRREDQHRERRADPHVGLEQALVAEREADDSGKPEPEPGVGGGRGRQRLTPDRPVETECEHRREKQARAIDRRRAHSAPREGEERRREAEESGGGDGRELSVESVQSVHLGTAT